MRIYHQPQVLLDAKDLLTTNKHVVKNFQATYPDIRVCHVCAHAYAGLYVCT